MITEGICPAWKVAILEAEARDEIRVALYTDGTSMSPAVERYGSSGEVQARGYKAGGERLSGAVVKRDGEGASLTWTVPVEWSNADIAARGALIYNASKGGRALAVVDFGYTVVSSNGPFRFSCPAGGLIFI